MSSPPIKRALVSVSDKLGLGDFCLGLVAAGVEIFSTGGTRRFLEAAGVKVRDVADYTGFPEMLKPSAKAIITLWAVARTGGGAIVTSCV